MKEVGREEIWAMKEMWAVKEMGGVKKEPATKAVGAVKVSGVVLMVVKDASLVGDVDVGHAWVHLSRR